MWRDFGNFGANSVDRTFATTLPVMMRLGKGKQWGVQDGGRLDDQRKHMHIHTRVGGWPPSLRRELVLLHRGLRARQRRNGMAF